MVLSKSLSMAAISAIALSSSAGISVAQAQEPELVGTVWELQQIQYNNDTLLTPDAPERYTIEFLDDGNVAIQADCNFVRGTYDVESADFITLGPSTLAACPPDSIDDEFRMGLEDAAIYFFQEGYLYMDMPADAGTLQFAPAAAMSAEEDPEVMEATETVEVTEPVEETAVEEAPAAEPVRGLW